MYSHANAACIECDTCKRLYSPMNFVCHSHKFESHTRHWGFDSANWRVYLKMSSSALATAQTSATAATTSTNVLNDIKNKDNIAANNGSGAVAAIGKQRHSAELEDEFDAFKKKFLSPPPPPPPVHMIAPPPMPLPPPPPPPIAKPIAQQSENFMMNAAAAAYMKRSLAELNSQLFINGTGGSLKSANELAAEKLEKMEKFDKMMSMSSSAPPPKEDKSGQKSLGEHKLLNGLLSKPLNNCQLDSTNR